MHKQRVTGLEEPFTAPDGTLLRFPGDPNAPPELVVNCRCTVTMLVPSHALPTPRTSSTRARATAAAL